MGKVKNSGCPLPSSIFHLRTTVLIFRTQVHFSCATPWSVKTGQGEGGDNCKVAKASTLVHPATGHAMREACSEDQTPHQTQRLEVHGQPSTQQWEEVCPPHWQERSWGILSLYVALLLGIDCPLQDLEGGRISFFHHRSYVQTILKKEFRLLET